MAPFKVIIIGGGLAGSLLANGLANNGVDVVVYERDAADSKREGYQIRLGEPAYTGFEACLTDEHRAAVLSKLGQTSGEVNTAPSIVNSRFETILDMSKFPSYSKSAAINRVVLRNILLDPIVALGRVQFGKKFVKYEIVADTKGNEHVDVHFSDGSVDTCDVLVGADGSGSKINHQLGLKNLVQIDTEVGFLHKGDLTPSVIEKLPARLQDGPVMVLTKKSRLYYSRMFHLAVLKPKLGKLTVLAVYLPAAAEQASQDANEIHFDLGNGSFFWGMGLNRSLVPYENLSDIPDKMQFVLGLVKDWAPEFHTMLSAGTGTDKSESVACIPIRASTKPSKQWRENLRRKNPANPNLGHPRVWLLEDAMHAMQPTRGMGGNQALLDCADMLPELRSLNDSSKLGGPVSFEQVNSALSRYEDKMIKRAFTWVAKSGGTWVPDFDFDGLLGKVIKFVGSLVLSLLSLLQGAKAKRLKQS